jgi:chromosome condensin MukBEF ATPase and DNA-binding subunit MukB
MKELYDYLSHKRDEMSESGKSTVEIDVKHLFKIHQMVCFMMQIKSIVNFDDDSEKLLRQLRMGVKDDA